MCDDEDRERDGLRRLLTEHPTPATARLGDGGMSRTLLHVATDRPGHFPHGADSVRALVEAGADIDAPGAVIAGGTPLADARAFGNREAGLRLVERAARTTLTDPATLGLIDRVAAAYTDAPAPTAEETSRAFWAACHGRRRVCAEYLLAQGADVNWIPDWEPLTPLDAAHREEAADLVAWLRERGGRSAGEIDAQA